MKKRKILSMVLCLALTLILVAGCLISCGNGTQTEDDVQKQYENAYTKNEGFFNKLFGYVLSFCYGLSGGYWGGGNYVLTLFIFALLMQLLLCPFGIIQQKNSIKQAKLAPKEMAIRNKYKGRNDQATMKKLQTEIQELYQKEGYSPMAGCLPMMLQLLIIFPIYAVVVNPLNFISGIGAENYASLVAEYTALGHVLSDRAPQIQLASWLANGGLGEISTELADKLAGFDFPSARLLWEDLGATPFESLGVGGPKIWLAIIPLFNLGLTYLSQFLSKKMSYRNPQAEQMNNSSMKIMLYGLPIMTLFITFMFPAAIGLYWIIRTCFSMLQQFIIFKTMKLPKFTEEDFKKAEKELKGTRKDKKAEAEYVVQPGQYRSLHHIDD